MKATSKSVCEEQCIRVHIIYELHRRKKELVD